MDLNGLLSLQQQHTLQLQKLTPSFKTMDDLKYNQIYFFSVII